MLPSRRPVKLLSIDLQFVFLAPKELLQIHLLSVELPIIAKTAFFLNKITDSMRVNLPFFHLLMAFYGPSILRVQVLIWYEYRILMHLSSRPEWLTRTYPQNY